MALTASSWWDGTLVALGLLAPLLLLRQWSPDGLPKGSILVVALSAASWALSAALGGSPLGVFALSLAGAMLVTRLPRHRLIATVALCAAAVGLGSLALLTRPLTVLTAESYLLIPAGTTLLVCAVMALVERYSGILLALERAKEAEADLAVARERIRFASDLHDIQGHTLHVIKLKTALAEQITDSDPVAAKQELTEVQHLISDTIARTHDLVHAQRRLNVAAEVENAKNLLEAAGIAVTVATIAPVGESGSALLAQVLRETTTNILRHSTSTRATITVDTHRIEIVNDGADAGPLPPLGGLSTLRDRLEEVGGALDVARGSGTFRTTATLLVSEPVASTDGPVR